MSREVNDLEREIAETRADLDDALDMLQAKLSPSALIGQAFGHAHNNPHMVSSGMGQMFAHRPFTALLMTAGLNWYLGRRAEKQARENDREWQAYNPGERHRVREIAGRAKKRVKAAAQRARTRASEVVHHASEAAHHAQDYAREHLTHAGEELHHAGDSAKDRMRHMTSAARDRAHTLADGTRRYAHDLNDMARERSHRMSEKVREKARKIRGGKARAESFVERQPLLAGAIALIVGTAIASAIPPTKPERKAARPLAAATKRLKRKAKEQIVTGVERGAEMATQALDTAATKIEEAMPGRPSVH
jgi:hypothetical protein